MLFTRTNTLSFSHTHTHTCLCKPISSTVFLVPHVLSARQHVSPFLAHPLTQNLPFPVVPKDGCRGSWYQ